MLPFLIVLIPAVIFLFIANLLSEFVILGAELIDLREFQALLTLNVGQHPALVFLNVRTNLALK